MPSTTPEQPPRAAADEAPEQTALPGLLMLLMHATERRTAGRPVGPMTEESRS